MEKNPKTKKCLKCNQIKPVTEYTKDKARKDNLFVYCKTCHTKIKNKNKRDTQDLKIIDNFKKLMYMDLKKRGYKMSVNDAFNYVPYSKTELLQHLKSTKENIKIGKGKDYDSLDHIVPRSRYNYSNPQDIEFQKCWSLNNLRILNFCENVKKSNKIIELEQKKVTQNINLVIINL